MNATKRKFNSLIQGLGTRPSPQPDEPKSTPRNDRFLDSSPFTSPLFSRTADSPSKGATSIGAGASSPFNENEDDLSITSEKRRQRTTTGGSSPGSEPKFCPGDRDQLIRRLATFQELTEWTPKPDKVSEIEWAKRGWVCRGKERVRCTLCNRELVVQTNKREVGDNKELVPVPLDSDIQEALVSKFAELMDQAHQEDCLWRKRACDDTLLRLPLANPQTALASLRERYDDLATRPSFLPYHFNLRLPGSIDLQSVKSQLPPTFFTDPPPPPSPPVGSTTPTNDVALALALTGWQGLTSPRIGPVPNSASCATCLRRLGLWMFKSKEVDEATSEILIPAPMDHLDPVREHRFFCPWRNPSAQRNPASKVKEGKAAWEVLTQTLKNTAYLREQAEKSNRPRAWHRPAASVPATPTKGGKGSSGEDQLGDEGQGQSPAPTPDTIAAANEEEDPALADAKDKERWARLRRVKSLFDTKNGKRLRRTLSRPSSAAPPSRPTTAHGTEATSAAEENEADKA
ncbi:hypothetical protein DL764_000024 [Monosporascus ibericus]|uniref:C3HC-type domain-containing protein n=1 Tax=Monosporascus ibericus TaxID=155417 RepID=A0A4Q4TVD0_9PEZI|nr:hypothetical protein DL764_000024 [Monosporascus ibericus]